MVLLALLVLLVLLALLALLVLSFGGDKYLWILLATISILWYFRPFSNSEVGFFTFGTFGTYFWQHQVSCGTFGYYPDEREFFLLLVHLVLTFGDDKYLVVLLAIAGPSSLKEKITEIDQ